MNAHERQQFDILLQTAVDHYAERLIQRNDGPDNARTRLLETPEAEGVWLSGFVDAVFQDSLLDNTAGACFVLEALERRPAPPVPVDICASAFDVSASSASSAAGISAESSASVSAPSGTRTIGVTMSALAREAFAALLRQKTSEELARRASYQSVPSAASAPSAAQFAPSASGVVTP